MVTAEVFPGEIRCAPAAAISRGRYLREGPANKMVGRAGIEPATNGLKVRCSTGLS
jgi:hypothetical protein